MQHSFLNLLRPALVPELRADISARTSCNVHLVLVGVSALRAYPDELAVFFFYLNLTVVTADLTVVTAYIILS